MKLKSKSKSKYLITVLAHPRTGTNYFMCLVHKYFPHINVNFEIFNPQCCFMNEKYIPSILQIYDLEPNISNRNRLVTLSRNYPLDFMNQIIKISEEDIIIHKIFPNHLSNSGLEKIIDISNLVIVLERDFLDVFISLAKTKYLLEKKVENPWIKVDTSHIKIRIEEEKYWLDYQDFQKWYLDNYQTIKLKNKTFFTIHYQNFHQMTTQQQLLFVQNILSNKIPQELLLLQDNNGETLCKQDKKVRYEDKIINFIELEKNGFFSKLNI